MSARVPDLNIKLFKNLSRSNSNKTSKTLIENDGLVINLFGLVKLFY